MIFTHVAVKGLEKEDTEGKIAFSFKPSDKPNQ
jgi:hypothetical protein